MRKHQGEIAHDGWMHNGSHFCGVFDSYMTIVSVFRNGKQSYEDRWVIPLLTESHISQVSDVHESEEGNEATFFDAETHVRYLELFFISVGTDFMTGFYVQLAITVI